MKKFLFSLLIPCIIYTMDVEIQKKNGIKHWDDVVMTVYQQKATQRMAYLLKKDNTYHASLYQTGKNENMWINPPKLENPEQIFEELQKEFSK